MLESQNPELEAAGSRQSWHDLYKSSSWIYVGGLDYGLTEGDIEAVFSQYGKIVQLNYVKDRDTGKPKGFSFINFEDQRSTVLSVDNLNGIRLCNRFLKVDHVRDYKPPDFNDKPRSDSRSFKDKRGGGAPDGRDLLVLVLRVHGHVQDQGRGAGPDLTEEVENVGKLNKNHEVRSIETFLLRLEGMTKKTDASLF
ncbi:hypothetical protein ACHWQZ_G009337 [Mnemiopsis leidyi]